MRRLLPILLIPALLALAPPAQADPVFSVMTPAETVASRTDRRPLAGGVHDPAAGVTFISWSGVNADTYVQAYDHASGGWTPPKLVAGGEADPHNYPTMVLADDGHLLIFRGMHNSRTVLSRAPGAHSLEGDWTHTELPEGDAASYPMPVKTARGTLVLFYRETTRELDPGAPTDFRPMKYLISRDNGRTWKNSVQLTGKEFAFGSKGRADHMDEVYVGQMRYEPGSLGRPERVHIVYTLAGGGPDQHLHDYYHRNIYYAWFNPASLRFHAADGRDLGTQVDDAEQEQYLKVADTPLERPAGLKSPDYIQQVGFGADGKPFVLWFQFGRTGDPLDHVARWTGSAWETRQVANGLRTREIEPAGRGSWRVYATRDGKPDIETYLLSGLDWRPEAVIPTPKPVQRVEVITNFRDPARILATGASSAREVSVADGDIYVVGTPN
ncbi:BNR-4 repeat-containing protein [Amycolatopsis magusensis]|uniref:BNR repeat-containing family member n=1 Tax=Amycolatopsis magusensis TaxID=882444 RepID=A0ABS4PMA1_9PSEU|nr:BNR-4 repeat-containing protein [Amycolatopsis magusensis]MBP2180546.1 hypothetical protein [Amycolatopsis magusensis]